MNSRLQWFHKTQYIGTTDRIFCFHGESKEAGLYHFYDFIIYKTQVVLQKAWVMLGANIIWLASSNDLVKLLSIIPYGDNSSSINKIDDSFLLFKHFDFLKIFAGLPINKR